MIAVLLKPPQGAPKTRLNTADRIGAEPNLHRLATADSPPFGIGNTPLHLAMESAHAEAAILLIEAGADRSRVRPAPTTPLFLVTNRVIMILGAGKSGQRDAGASYWRRGTGAETRQGVCYFALRPSNVTLARDHWSLYKSRHVMFVFRLIDNKVSFIDCCLVKN